MAQYATTPAALITQYTALVTLLSPTHVPRVVTFDADDDHVLAAVAARADLLVTGDQKHLLPLGTYENIPIVTAAQALQRIEAQPGQTTYSQSAMGSAP